jgi:Holliday junction resolvase RusA-like endonuclease
MKATVEVWQLPKSENSRSRHHMTRHMEKMSWEYELFYQLRSKKNRMAKRGVQITVPLKISCIVRWDKPGPLPDPDNIEPSIKKPTNDALQKAGWIPNDTQEYVSWQQPDIRRAEGGKGRVEITIEWIDQEGMI